MKDISNLFSTLKHNLGMARILATRILHSPHNYGPWSLQGFGMLRLYLTPEIRMHVWNTDFTVKDVSLIHDHPWDFNSLVLTGTIINRRYQKSSSHPDIRDNFTEATIVCGAGGGLVTEKPCVLNQLSVETYTAGNHYIQRAEEIHSSHPSNGTVTIVERQFRKDTEHAHVYYPVGTQWGSAEPRRATVEEINTITASANI